MVVPNFPFQNLHLCLPPTSSPQGCWLRGVWGLVEARPGMSSWPWEEKMACACDPRPQSPGSVCPTSCKKALLHLLVLSPTDPTHAPWPEARDAPLLSPRTLKRHGGDPRTGTDAPILTLLHAPCRQSPQEDQCGRRPWPPSPRNPQPLLFLHWQTPSAWTLPQGRRAEGGDRGVEPGTPYSGERKGQKAQKYLTRNPLAAV